MEFPQTPREALKCAAHVIQSTGFVVLSVMSHSETDFEIGDETKTVFGIETNQPFKIISRATKREWIEQRESIAQMLGIKAGRQLIPRGNTFWKAVTD